MAETKYGKYIISDPKIAQQLAHHSKEAEYPWKNPAEVYLDGDLIPGCPAWLDINWIYDTHLPSVPGWVKPHKHAQNEILFFLATKIEISIGKGKDREKHTFSHTTAVFIPAGLTHCPIVYKSVDKNKPQIMLALLFNPEYT